jgi:tetratricopeptide (TPR) repeat protein
MSLDPTDPAINERYLNDLGYDLLNRTRIKLAQDIFKVNTILYSESFNAYDSYAEACMIIGEIDLAIKNYNNSLRLNPQNINAVEMLKKLQKSE